MQIALEKYLVFLAEIQIVGADAPIGSLILARSGNEPYWTQIRKRKSRMEML